MYVAGSYHKVLDAQGLYTACTVKKVIVTKSLPLWEHFWGGHTTYPKFSIGNLNTRAGSNRAWSYYPFSQKGFRLSWHKYQIESWKFQGAIWIILTVTLLCTTWTIKVGSRKKKYLQHWLQLHRTTRLYKDA